MISEGQFTFLYSGSEVKVFVDEKSNKTAFVFGRPLFRTSGSSTEHSLQGMLNYFDKAGITSLARSLKGNFVLGIISKKYVYIVSDRFGIYKFFYFHKEGEFFASDSLRSLTQLLTPTISKQGIIKYVLGYHFISGSTVFNNILHNAPAEIITVEGDIMRKSKYWDARELLVQEKRGTGITEVVSVLEKSLISELDENNVANISLSLTGGGDTRNLLALMLKNKFKLSLFTYGNPNSVDCLRASEISDGLKLDHEILDIQMTKGLFEETARKIVREGNSLSSIHRAHRLLSIIKQSAKSDTLLLGTLGGEFVKGVDEDDYITPKFIYKHYGCELNEEIVASSLSEKGILTNRVDIEKLTEFFKGTNYFSGSAIERKISVLSEITAHLHDAQDITLFKRYIKNVVTPFLDIDYLEALFSSKFSFDIKERITPNWKRKIQFPEFSVKLINEVYPELLRFHYSGGHKPSEILYNKYYGAVRRLIRQVRRPSYPQNFPLSYWMKAFVLEELPKCNDHQILREVFDLDELQKLLHNPNQLGTTERFWLKYTNPIMMRYIIEEFGV